MADGHKARITIKDIAREADVSIASVSFVLNNSGSVSAKVRARVMATVERLGYRRNQSAKTMRTGRSRTIGLLLPDLCNPFFPELAHSIGNAARRAGYAVILIESNDGATEKEALDQLAIHGVDGICWCPSSKRDLVAELNLSIPVVVIDRPLPRRDVVISNYAMGGELLADHILAAGYPNLALITGPKDFPGTAQRRDGLIQALQGRLPIIWEVANAFSTDLQPEALAALERNNASLIACANDTIAIGVMRALTQRGLRVPDDVGVVGFDDIPWSVLVDPPLTTIRQPVGAIGGAAVEVLMNRIEAPNGPVRQIQLDVELMPRRSSR